MRRPGALHKARWMAKLLYSLKIILLSEKINELPKGSVFGSGQFRKLVEFTQFFTFCYIPWWISCPLPAAAPTNDIKLLETLYSFKQQNTKISTSAIKAFKNHLWYLTQELIPLSLFDTSLSPELKTTVAKQILMYDQGQSSQQRKGTGHGKPIFPDLDGHVELSNLVGADCYTFFRILDIDCCFLMKPAKEWQYDDNYIKGKQIVNNLCVVNDAAERGVKLCHDFLHTAKSDESLQKVLQVVDNCRARLPNQRKRKLEGKRWFLKLNTV